MTASAAAVLSFVLACWGVLDYTRSDAHRTSHDPWHGLQQLDMLYLDEPAPAARELGLRGARPAVVVFCRACELPVVPAAQVLRSDRADIAALYGLRRVPGEPGPGYALVDSGGRVRYRTYDPTAAEHAREIRILVDGMSR